MNSNRPPVASQRTFPPVRPVGLGPAGPNASTSHIHIHVSAVSDRFPPGPFARDDIGGIHAPRKPLDLQLRPHRAVIGQMTAVHHESKRIEEIVCYQLPVGLRGGYRRDLKVRAVLVGKEPSRT